MDSNFLDMICENTNARDALTPELSTTEVVSPAKKSSGVAGIGAMTQNLLMKVVDGKGLTYTKILSMIQDEFPGRSSIHCVRWYASKMNKAGAKLPEVRG